MPRIIPVIDLKGGLVVRGIGGRRDEYRPIVSKLTDSCRPLEVARAFREQFSFTEIYVADLDAIAGLPPAWDTYAELLNDGFELLVDAGVRDQWSALALSRAGVQRIVVGLETVVGPEAVSDIVGALGSSAVVFSLDLKNGEPLGDRQAWDEGDPSSIADDVVALGVRRLIVLDLAAVGSSAGTGTGVLCQAIHERHPQVEIIAGGGLRSMADVRALEACGVQGVLVASALHDGRIRPEEMD